MKKNVFINKIDNLLKKIRANIIYFYNKKNADDENYSINYLKWILEVTIKNKIIHSSKSSKDKEMVRRRRSRVYWIDFGKNIGSEFNDPHFLRCNTRITIYCNSSALVFAERKYS